MYILTKQILGFEGFRKLECNVLSIRFEHWVRFIPRYSIQEVGHLKLKFCLSIVTTLSGKDILRTGNLFLLTVSYFRKFANRE